ncbi:MAG: hypothetical protein IH985_02350 [Planctomycetes bacterium]|nr:hypothetical protein [Planctomycetota bacterium]
MKIGDTFLITKPGRTLDTHLWIVLSDPAANPDKVLIVNLTSCKDRKSIDESCILDVGDHPWVREQSYVNYLESEVKLIKESEYAKLLGPALINPQKPLENDTLDRVLRGAAITDRLGLGQRELLKNQGLI